MYSQSWQSVENNKVVAKILRYWFTKNDALTKIKLQKKI